jgi:hypothetical protein
MQGIDLASSVYVSEQQPQLAELVLASTIIGHHEQQSIL